MLGTMTDTTSGWRARRRIIPLAQKGFVDVHPEYNPIGYYFEDIETGRVAHMNGPGFPTFEAAEAHGDAWEREHGGRQ
jgi:hypothetical protein